MKNIFCIALILLLGSFAFKKNEPAGSWIRINQLGYMPNGIKVAVWCTKTNRLPETCVLVDSSTHETVYHCNLSVAYGAYGPFTQTARIDFTGFTKPGRYFIKAGDIISPVFPIADDVYKGAADFCLRYMRQQRSGFNPFLKDSCHTHDGYTLYGPMPDSTHIDVTGGWHDASDYLQYTTTSANAAYHLLAAYRDFPQVFGDVRQANGLEGANGVADVLDEARWGIDWLLKMNPKDGWLFNQLGDDRDHKGMRIPKEDTNYYGRGVERPVYFCSGKPQVRGKFMNATTGIASTAGKFASSFALASQLYAGTDPAFSEHLLNKAKKAFEAGQQQPGVCQTASVRSPYIYAEGNWTDDMELAAAALQLSDAALQYAREEPVTPWLGADSAGHYQWYPFVNVGHYELAKQLKGKSREMLIDDYRKGIEKVFLKARTNAFFRAIPFIWCSNNLTVAFATQCYWYRQLTGDDTYYELEQANLDWLFGCNPWGTSMVYGLPAWGDTPEDPHSAFTHLKAYPIDGGLVDGPVYTSIYKSLIGIHLNNDDEYEAFQSDLAVYHDDYGDYSTNEPTMDGTASLIYLLAAKEAETQITDKGKHIEVKAGVKQQNRESPDGALVRGDSSLREIGLVFTGDEWGEGLPVISRILQQQRVKGSFFFTGRFYRNQSFQPWISALQDEQHYLGPHSDAHLLYCDWKKRDSTLITRGDFIYDLNRNLQAMREAGVADASYRYFIPPYEWWNNTITRWCHETGIRLFSLTLGTITNADYTWPEMGIAYKSSDTILQRLYRYNETRPGKLNGAVLLIHAGTDPRRTDKLYNRLNELIDYLKKEGYSLKRIDELFADH